MIVVINMHKTSFIFITYIITSCHVYEGVMLVLCAPLQVKCYLFPLKVHCATFHVKKTQILAFCPTHNRKLSLTHIYLNISKILLTDCTNCVSLHLLMATPEPMSSTDLDQPWFNSRTHTHTHRLSK